jgi:hypothetical protein
MSSDEPTRSPRKPFRLLPYALAAAVLGPALTAVCMYVGIGLGLGQVRNEGLILFVIALMYSGLALTAVSLLYVLGWVLYWLVGRL